MVKIADLRDREDLSLIQQMHGPGSRCVLVKTEVRPAPLVVLEVAS
jgi:hypothetical protein